MRCREGHDPFTQFEKDLLSFHAGLPVYRMNPS
jgi:hypothetical protein